MTLHLPLPVTCLRRIAASALVALSFLFALTASEASVFTWAGATTGALGGGNDVWDTTSTNWLGAATWDNSIATGNSAAFGGVSGTVGLSSVESVNANLLTFSVPGYTLQSGTLNLNSTTPTVNTSHTTGTTAIASVISGTSGLTKSGSGALSLTAVNSFTGTTTISSGTLTVGGAGSIGSAGAIVDSGVFEYASSLGQTLSGGISGTGAVIKSGGGTLVLNTSNSFTGGFAVNAGTVRIQSGGAGGFGGNGNGMLYLGDTGGATSNVTLSFQTSPTFSNPITVRAGNAGSVTFTTFGNYGPSFSGSITLNKSASFNNASNGSTTLSINGVVTGSGGLNVYSSAASCLVKLSGSNSYTGGTTLSSGILRIALNNSLGATTGALAVNGGMLDLNGKSITVGLLSGNSASAVISSTAAGAMTLTANSASNGTYAGSIQNGAGTLGLVKQGSGALTLSGSSNYTGGTRLSAGSLKLTNANALGAATGTLVIDAGTVDCNANLSVGLLSGSLGTLITNSSTASVTLTVNSGSDAVFAGVVQNGSGKVGVSKQGSGMLTLSGSASAIGDTTVSGGTLVLNGAYLADWATVTLSTGATLNLARNQVDRVARLFIDGVAQTAGWWGAPGSVAAGLAQFESPCITGSGILLATDGAEPTPTTLDPTGAAFTGTLSSEFDTADNFESWVASQVTGATVAGGALSAVSNSSAPSVALTQIASGPNLDLGFNDYLEIRIQVPAGYAGDIQFSYGTATSPGFSSDRMFSIPAANVAKDGAFHTYRLDLGLERNWRGTLTDLSIKPVNAAGLAFAIDYLRIGDLPGDVYLPNTTDQPVTAYELSSKHFRFIWDANRAASGMNATKAQGCLRNAEEVWQVYVKVLGYREPSQSTDLAQRDGNKYKVNFLCIYDGYWMGGSPTNFGYLNIDPSGLQVDPPTWVLPHEGMHVFQMHNSSGYVPGEWWEEHANYGRERWLNYYSNLYPNASNIDAQAIRDSHMAMAMGRNYYLTWPFFVYVDENPDGLPDLYDGLVAKVWQETQSSEYSMMTLDRLTPTTSLKDIVGYYARRGATMNYTHQSAINAALATQDPVTTARHQFTDLVQRSDDPTWWRVPMEKAPMQGAYALHELVPAGAGAGRVIIVNLRGLADSTRGADLRASFIAINDVGIERYTPLWHTGSSSITLAANENKLYLAVAGTPDVFYKGGHDEPTVPYRSHPSKARFYYETQVTGATPRERDNGASTGLVQHANGGGWKTSSATVDATAYVGPNARVLGTAQVRNNARVEDFAVVENSAQVLNNAVVSGHAWVHNNAVVRDNARVRDWGAIEGGTLSEFARVFEHARVSGTMAGTSTAKGSSMFIGAGTLSGNAIVDGDYYLARDIANGTTFGHLPYVGVPDSFITPTPAWLYADYDFATAHDSRALDKYGVTDGYLIGSPTWVAADAKRKGFLTFDGATQYIGLDRSIADVQQFTFTAWVRPAGGVANQCVLWLGATSTRRLCFTPDDGTGHAKFSINNNSVDQTLTAATTLSPGVWTHVAVTLDGTTGTLFFNGTSVASSAIAIIPEQLLAANTATAAQHNYLARSEAAVMPQFRGALDDVQFYTHALASTDVAALAFTGISNAGTLYVDLRASDASAGAATWINNGTIGNFSRTGSPSKVANVLSSGFPGVQFNGSNQAYTGPNTVADIDGGGDRTIEAWAWNPALDDEESMVSWGHRGDSSRNMAFNFGSNTSWGAATHWGADLGWGASPPSAGAWHHVAYTYDGIFVRVYIDGALANSGSMSSPLNTWPGEPLNLACQRDSANGSRSHYFSGYLNSVRVHGGVLSAAQISMNAALGPVGAAANVPPTIAAIANQTLDYGATSGPISITLSDPDTAPEALLLSGSAGNAALMDPASIVFSGTGASRTLTLIHTPGFFGTTTVTLSAGDGAAFGTTTFTLTVLSPEETWRKTNFGSIANSGAASRTADPDRDGLSNLMEFATGSNPNAPGTTSQRIARNGSNLEYIYTRSKAALEGGCSFTVEYSDTLAPGSWRTSGVTESQPLLFDDGLIETVKVLVPVGTGPRFVRLRVNQP